MSIVILPSVNNCFIFCWSRSEIREDELIFLKANYDFHCSSMIPASRSPNVVVFSDTFQSFWHSCRCFFFCVMMVLLFWWQNDVHVSEPMRVELSPIRVEVTVGESVVLSCKVTHDPSLDVSFLWLLNNQPLNTQQDGSHFEYIQTVSDFTTDVP